jgi:hypothetical protein
MEQELNEIYSRKEKYPFERLTALMDYSIDNMLISQAKRMDWHEIDSLIVKAQSEETKQELLLIQKKKYRAEEYEADLL